MIYLIHFDRPYKHARHYLGFSTNPDPAIRLQRHTDGRGARLLKVISAVGIAYKVVRIWKDGTRQQQRRLKHHSSTRLCPICNPVKFSMYGAIE